jgi:hypothetical protein
MTEKKKVSLDDRRAAPRIPLEGPVTVRIMPGQILGVCQNLSANGILLHAEGDIRVEVVVSKLQPPLAGKLVRVQHVNEKVVSIGIKFDDEDALDSPAS